MPVTRDEQAILAGNRAVHAVEAAYYDRVHSEIFNFWQQRVLDRDLARALALLPGTRLRVLDIGCGTGNVALRLWRRGHLVDAVDLSEEMLARFRTKQPGDERLRLHCADADTFLQSAGSYDLISFSSVLHHLPDYTTTLKRCVQALGEKGVLFVTHEPLPKTGQRAPSGLHEGVSRLSAFVDRVCQRMAGIRMPAIDYGLSDVHVDEGISPEALFALFEQVGMRTVGVRRYRAERLGIAALLNNVVFRVPPREFSLVAQRT
jgi:ubiquinone/menaquinone biosynthesis C-methylase UbiE